MVYLQVFSFQRNFILLLRTALTVAPMARYRSLLGLMMISYRIMSTECSLVLEEGYTVETVFHGNKMGLHPYDILPLEKDIIVLDSVKSSFFRIKLPISDDILIELFAGSGNGVPGFADGDITKAAFNHPKAFTVDAKGNIYVADRSNFAIRKISKSGVSTIAGGMASINGHDDGPSQNATFSTDFGLTFVPSICSLLVSDRGNGVIRQIKLPHSECTQHTELGTHWVIPVMASLVSFLLGLFVMFFLQPHIACTGRFPFSRSREDAELFPNEHGEASVDELLCHAKRSC